MLKQITAFVFILLITQITPVFAEAQKRPAELFPAKTFFFANVACEKDFITDPSLPLKLQNYFVFKEIINYIGMDFLTMTMIASLAPPSVSFGLLDITPGQNNTDTARNADLNMEEEKPENNEKMPFVIIMPISDNVKAMRLSALLGIIKEQNRDGYVIFQSETYSSEMYAGLGKTNLILSNNTAALDETIKTISGKAESLAKNRAYTRVADNSGANILELFADVEKIKNIKEYDTDEIFDTASEMLTMTDTDKSIIKAMESMESFYITAARDKNGITVSSEIRTKEETMKAFKQNAKQLVRELETSPDITTNLCSYTSSDDSISGRVFSTLLDTAYTELFGIDWGKNVRPVCHDTVTTFYEITEVNLDTVYSIFSGRAYSYYQNDEYEADLRGSEEETSDDGRTPEEVKKTAGQKKSKYMFKYPVMVAVELKNPQKIAEIIPQDFRKRFIDGHDMYQSQDGTVVICAYENKLLFEKTPYAPNKIKKYLQTNNKTLAKNKNIKNIKKFINENTVMVTHDKIDAYTSMMKGFILVWGEDFRACAEKIGAMEDVWTATSIEKDRVVVKTVISAK